MKPELKIDINVDMNVDEETARLALLIVEIYCNKNGFLPLGNRQADGTIKYSFQGDYGKEVEKR